MFDAPRVFGTFAMFAVGGSLLTYSVGGAGSLTGVLVGLFFVHRFVNALDNRQRGGRKPHPSRRRRRRR